MSAIMMQTWAVFLCEYYLWEYLIALGGFTVSQ